MIYSVATGHPRGSTSAQPLDMVITEQTASFAGLFGPHFFSWKDVL